MIEFDVDPRLEERGLGPWALALEEAFRAATGGEKTPWERIRVLTLATWMEARGADLTEEAREVGWEGLGRPLLVVTRQGLRWRKVESGWEGTRETAYVTIPLPELEPPATGWADEDWFVQALIRQAEEAFADALEPDRRTREMEAKRQARLPEGTSPPSRAEPGAQPNRTR